MSGCVKRLLKTVKMRKKQIAKSNFDEKLTSEFTPYTAAQDIPRLEDFFFQKIRYHPFIQWHLYVIDIVF